MSLQIRRIQKELQSLESDPPANFRASAVNNNLFEWHFTIRGPQQSNYEQGIYHGKIDLPADYPIKPPNIYFLTPNGRFEIKTKICLSITKYHPENWNPSWTIRTMLEGMIQHFHVSDFGVGSITSTPQHAKKLALASHSYVCDDCGPIINIIKPYAQEQIKPVEVVKQPVQIQEPQEQRSQEYIERIQFTAQMEELPQEIQEDILKLAESSDQNNDEESKKRIIDYIENKIEEEIEDHSQNLNDDPQEQVPQQQQGQSVYHVILTDARNNNIEQNFDQFFSEQGQQQGRRQEKNSWLSQDQMNPFDDILFKMDAEIRAYQSIQYIQPQVIRHQEPRPVDPNQEYAKYQVRALNILMAVIVIGLIVINGGEYLFGIIDNFINP